MPEPVDDVVVRVYDANGTTLITEGTTGDVLEGAVELVLDGDVAPTEYQLRFFIAGGRISMPQQIAVYSPASSAPTGANNFQITAELFTLPAAIDTSLCRASGVIRGPGGSPRRGIDIHFIPLYPAVVGGQAVLGERVAVRTDKNGYVQVDLVRGLCYYATVESDDDRQREVVVPDRSSINIAHLLYPIVAVIEYSPAPPWTINVGDQLTIVPTVICNDFRELQSPAADDVDYSTVNDGIASVSVLADAITLTGVSAGTTTLNAVRKDKSLVYLPEPGVDGGAETVTVV